jgi:penicillin-binding protein 2
MANESPRLRLSILGIVALSLFGALFARLWYLQVMAAPEYKVEAQANRVRTVTEEAPRGRILDAKGRVIVGNRTSRVVTVDPVALRGMAQPDRDALVLKLAETLTSFGVPIKVSTVDRQLSDTEYNPLQPIPVAIDVPEELQMYLAEREEDFPSVEVTRESVRDYPSPDKTTAAHLLGYVSRISEAEYDARKGADKPKPYQPDSPIGKGGVEQAYEDDLRGKPGVRVIEVDANNRPIRTVEYTAPEPGNDIQLTIDLDVQRMAEQALREQLDATRGGRQQDSSRAIKKAPAGSVVILNPQNGGVLAAASYPTYDPEEFVNGISSARYAQLTGGAEADNPLINRAIQGQYAPGSTFKPITAYAAMMSGLIDANTHYNDRGVYDAGDREFTSTGAKGSVNVPQAITVSSDVYFYWVGHNFYRQRDTLGNAMQDAARAFGFDAESGIPITGEQPGLILDPDRLARLYEQNPEGFDSGTWLPGFDIQGAIGQNTVLVTPIQLANAYATLGNGGTLYQPNVVWRVLKANSDPNDPANVVRVVDPVVRAQLPMPPEVADPIIDGLIGVTNARGGTATATFAGFDQSGFQIAAKTGTAQVDGKADTSVFAGFAPVGAPQYAFSAFLEESGFGSDAAAPVMRRVLELLAGLNISNVAEIATGVAD